MIRLKHILVGVVISLLAHFSALYASLYMETNSAGSIAPGEGGLVVSVGLAGSYSESSHESQKQTITQAEPEAETDTEPTAVVNPDPVIEPLEAEPKVAETPKAIAETAPQAEPEAVIEPVKKVAPQTKPVQTEAVAVPQQIKQEESVATTETKTVNSVQSISVQRATGTGEHIETGGKLGLGADYKNTLTNLIARQKRYPRSARQDNITGTTIVTFVIRGNGKIKSPRVITSSGDARLDQEALAMLQRANPFPPIPAEINQKYLALTLPIEFSLKANRTIF